jgi:hypothetical protein
MRLFFRASFWDLPWNRFCRSTFPVFFKSNSRNILRAAKKDENEMFARLVQIATEVKNLSDNFIKSIIDEENNSLLHYLVVWGYDAGIQLLETESTWNTTFSGQLLSICL